jgi:AcrR family transcriptional regulator
MAYRRTERVIQRLNARRDSVVVAARDIAGEDGLDAVQIVPVAARAGIAAGTVYRYFPSKTDLVAALIEGITAQEAEAMRLAAASAPGPLSALAAGIVTFSARVSERRRLAWAVFAQPVDREIEGLRTACHKSLVAEFERLIAAAEGDHLPGQDAALAAVSVFGGLLAGLIGPLASAAADSIAVRDRVQTLSLMSLRSLGVIDARARGLVVQAAWPAHTP